MCLVQYNQCHSPRTNNLNSIMWVSMVSKWDLSMRVNS